MVVSSDTAGGSGNAASSSSSAPVNTSNINLEVDNNGTQMITTTHNNGYQTGGSSSSTARPVFGNDTHQHFDDPEFELPDNNDVNAAKASGPYKPFNWSQHANTVSTNNDGPPSSTSLAKGPFHAYYSSNNASSSSGAAGAGTGTHSNNHQFPPSYAGNQFQLRNIMDDLQDNNDANAAVERANMYLGDGPSGGPTGDHGNHSYGDGTSGMVISSVGDDDHIRTQVRFIKPGDDVMQLGGGAHTDSNQLPNIYKQYNLDHPNPQAATGSGSIFDNFLAENQPNTDIATPTNAAAAGTTSSFKTAITSTVNAPSAVTTDNSDLIPKTPEEWRNVFKLDPEITRVPGGYEPGYELDNQITPNPNTTATASSSADINPTPTFGFVAPPDVGSTSNGHESSTLAWYGPATNTTANSIIKHSVILIQSDSNSSI